MACSIRTDPNPRRAGATTAGPPDSRHSSRKESPSRRQVTSTRPDGPDKAPCFTALVASSCSTRPTAPADCTGIGTSSPSMTARSPRRPKGASETSTSSRSGTEPPFVRQMVACMRASAARRPRNVSPKVSSDPDARSVISATACTVERVFFTRWSSSCSRSFCISSARLRALTSIRNPRSAARDPSSSAGHVDDVLHPARRDRRPPSCGTRARSRGRRRSVRGSPR